jgi:hypothetical protein
MKRTLILLLASLLLPIRACAQVTEWHSAVVLKAAFGNGEKEFLRNGYHDEGEGEGGGIAGSYVCSEGIFISDAVRHNVKVFDLAGNYQRTISITWQYPNEVRDISLGSFVVTKGVMYFLSDMGGPAQHGLTRYSAYSFDLETGKQIERMMIHNGTLGYDLGGHPVGNAVRLVVDGEGDISVWDYIRQISYPFIRAGGPVKEEQQIDGTRGRLFGGYRLASNRESGTIDFLDGEGMPIGKNCRGSLVIASPDGRLILADVLERKGRQSEVIRIIYDQNCTSLGRIPIPANSRWAYSAFQPIDPFQFGPDGRLYEISVARDGVTIFLWSN